MKLAIVLAVLLSAFLAIVAAGQLRAQTNTTGIGTTTPLPPTTVQTTTPSSTTTVQATTPSSTTTVPTTTTPTMSTPTASATTTATSVVQNVVEISRMVPASTTAITAFTVPTGQTLVLTDVLLTNTGAAATCGAAINRAGNAAAVTAPTATGATPGATAPTLAGTITRTDSSITGPLCVPPRTTTALPLTTGIEFGAGQTVQLVHVPETTTAGGTAEAAGVAFHLRGVLIAG